MMGGWKTWAGALLIGIAAAGRALFPDLEEVWSFLLKLGGLFGLVGLGHKIEKALKG